MVLQKRCNFAPSKECGEKRKSMSTRITSIRKQPGFIMAVNFLLLMIVYMLSRWVFYYMNISNFPDVTFHDMMTICLGGLRFDISALCYLNMLCILLQ